VNRTFGSLEVHPLMVKDGFLNLPNGSLKAVIAGCEAEYKDIGAIVMSAELRVEAKRDTSFQQKPIGDR
jgi:hypothetical protein